MGIHIQLSELPSAPCRGAFFLAMKSLGQVTSLDEISQKNSSPSTVLQPVSDHYAFYDRLYRFYEKVYQANQGFFRYFS